MKICPFLSHEHPLRFAHRGSTILWPENTMTAFQGAVDLGCRYIETDVHVTRDGVMVTFHDDRLERVTNGAGPVKDWNRDDLRTLDAAYYFNPGDGFPLRGKGIGIPSLEEVMTTFPGIMLNIDLKQRGIEQLAADFIRRHHFQERVLIASFHDKRVRRFRGLTGNLVATSSGIRETLAVWVRSRFKQRLKVPPDALQVPPHRGGITVVDHQLIKAAHAAGMQVHTWTINDPQEMHRLLDLGVDGIVTDRPDLLNHVLAERKKVRTWEPVR
jgi:glycerophosphoryl diester phosphodiesterase